MFTVFSITMSDLKAYCQLLVFVHTLNYCGSNLLDIIKPILEQNGRLVMEKSDVLIIDLDQLIDCRV